MSSLKPIIFWGHKGTPNPQKVAIILEELGLAYEVKDPGMDGIKKKPYTDINPNGRVPAIEDPNTGITLWESGAILQYLVATYDRNETLTYTTIPEKYQLNQWLMFQVSGQGPYFGQAAWFKIFHQEKLPSAVERYVREAERVTGVLNDWLQQNDGHLVGKKITYADLAFVPWASRLSFLDDGKSIDLAKYPAYSKWLESMQARDSVKKILAEF